MTEGRRCAVSPLANGPNGTHPTLVLMSDGVIFPSNGAGLPLRSSADTAPSEITDWNTPRFTPQYNTTAGRPNSDIGRDIRVTDWTNLADIKGHVIDGWGNTHPFGTGTTKLNITTGYWPGFDVARALILNPAGTGGFVLDYSGGLHRVGTQATGIAAFAYFPNADLARDVVCRFNSPPGVDSGFVLDGWGGMQKFSTHTNDVWMDSSATPVYGGTYHPGWDIMRAMEFDFVTMTGFVMDGWGGVTAMGVGAANSGLGLSGQGPGAPGGPYWNGWDIARDFEWPAPPSRFFVTLDGLGTPHPWNQFIIPALVFTSPPVSLTNTSRPAVSFTYGVGQNPAPSPMTDVAIWIYPLSVTNQVGFREDQGAGAVFSYYRSGITGVNAGSTFSVTLADDLDDATQYKVYVKATSTEAVSSGWVSRAFTTAYNRPAAPTLSGANQNNNLTGARNSLTASGSGTFQFQFSDDPTSVVWYDVAGATQTTSTTVFDYDAIFQRSRKYRVFKVTPSPYLKSNASNIVTLTFALPTAGASWSLSSLSSTPFVVNIHAAQWTKTLHQQSEVHYPANAIKGVVLSGGVRGISGELEMWLKTRQEHDDLMTLLATAQTLKLQNPGGEQWYVWAGDVSFDLVLTPPGTFVYKAKAQLTEVERPLVVV